MVFANGANEEETKKKKRKKKNERIHKNVLLFLFDTEERGRRAGTRTV